jgi:hypothetical protein
MMLPDEVGCPMAAVFIPLDSARLYPKNIYLSLYASDLADSLQNDTIGRIFSSYHKNDTIRVDTVLLIVGKNIRNSTASGSYGMTLNADPCTDTNWVNVADTSWVNGTTTIKGYLDLLKIPVPQKVKGWQLDNIEFRVKELVIHTEQFWLTGDVTVNAISIQQ